jgi:hypothetical protein
LVILVESGRRKYLGENLLQCYFVHLKHQKDCPGNKVPVLHVEKLAINRMRIVTGCLVWLDFKTIMFKQMEIIRGRKISAVINHYKR